MKKITSLKKMSKKELASNVVAVGITTIQIASCIAMCSAGGTPDQAINSLISTICTVFGYVGMGILVLGIAKFALALKDENGPGQSQAILYAVAGAVLMGINGLVSWVGGAGN